MPRFVDILKIHLAGGQSQEIILTETTTAKHWIHLFHTNKLVDRLANLGDVNCPLPWSVATKAVIGMQLGKVQVPDGATMPGPMVGTPQPLLPPPKSGL